MRKGSNTVNSNLGNKVHGNHHKNGTTTRSNGFVPNSLKFISSCIKTVSSNVKSAGASVAGSISGDSADDLHKDQVLWASFDRIEIGGSVRRVLLIGYSNGFQVLDVSNGSNVSELVSRRDDPVTFLLIQPTPAKNDSREGYRALHPMLLVVASDEASYSGPLQNGRDGFVEPQSGKFLNPTAVRFYSLQSHNYIQVLRFRSTVYMVRCSPQVVAVGLAAQIYCFDALTLENKFSVLTYPVPQLGGQGFTGVNIGYGPMAVGPRWLAYASNNPLISNMGRLSPQSLSPSPGVSPSTSPSSGNLVARYAMESSKQLASGLINLGDMGYKTFSKYCHDFIPDGSTSPMSPNSHWKSGRSAVHSSESDAAGMVIIKDFVSRTVISQFRAHSSPISALCFDLSGTLLVTASIHGNNINIFRILPSRLQNGGSGDNYDWSSSHVHLYKLHRGMTSAVIQDICFSHYSQWVAIVSSKGTCHVFVLSPFGGETGLQLQSYHADGPTLSPMLSVPWWSTSSFLLNQQASTPPPALLTLSVVCRIKTGNWLNTVSHAASSAAGKVSPPSGVIAAVFHNSVHQNVQSTSSNAKAIEHLMAYSPSGHLVQYELVSSLGGNQNESPLRNGTSTMVQIQEDDLVVKAEPVQRWDVCRRADWPEKEDYIQGVTLGGQEAEEAARGTNVSEDSNVVEKDGVKSHERSHWYLSNAEVQLRSGRIPIWQKSKIYFYAMSHHGYGEQNFVDEDINGEIEIEKIPSNEVEIKRRELLPVFDQFRGVQPDWTDNR
ncbi:OLC1v1000618C1 [Oldenlandia corymbosa var. corymbosa]|nr:OLC1v1000618C1 [Oldenlandia corymbosa var. corymbosa]